MSSLWLYLTFLAAISVYYAHARDVYKQPRRDWQKVAKEEMEKAKKLRPINKVAKNAILFMGDGMGIGSVMAARVYNAQQNKKTYNDARFAFEKWPYTALSMTYSSNTMVTDSAASATSYLTGEKGPYSTIGVNQDASWGHCHTEKGTELYSTLYHCAQEGKSAGFVTTARVTHASPAGTFVHTVDRRWESDSTMPDNAKGKCKDIATQLIENGDFLQVIMGGGRTNFLPNTTFDPEYPDKKGARVDGVNLIEAWKNKANGKSYKYVENLIQLNSVDLEKVDRLLGLFEPSHMHYEVNRETAANNWPEPSLTEMVEKAIKILQRNKKGYCLFVESARIDHAHHDANAYKALTDTLEFSRAIQNAETLVKEKETLLITTADHSLPIMTNGYTGINTDILGAGSEIINGTEEVVELGKDGLPYGVLNYGNGPPSSFNFHNTNGSVDFRNAERRNITQDFESGLAYDKDYLQFTGVPLRYVSHSGEEVGIYAKGPMAHFFHGVHENDHIAHTMQFALCVGQYKNNCAREYEKEIAEENCEMCPKGSAVQTHTAMSTFHLSFCMLIAIIRSTFYQ